MKTLGPRGEAALRYDVVRLHLEAHGLPHRPCGLNADWSVSAWHLGPGLSPNHDTERQLYLLDNETDVPGQEYDLVWRRFDPEKDEESEFETVIESSSLFACCEEAVVELQRQGKDRR